MSSPWAKIQPVEGPVSLLEITSEQLAKSLHDKWVINYSLTFILFKSEKFKGIIFVDRELKKSRVETVEDVNIQDCAICETDDTDNDTVIAHMLQDQYNKEYDLMLKRTEEKFNRDSKGD